MRSKKRAQTKTRNKMHARNIIRPPFLECEFPHPPLAIICLFLYPYFIAFMFVSLDSKFSPLIKLIAEASDSANPFQKHEPCVFSKK